MKKSTIIFCLLMVMIGKIAKAQTDTTTYLYILENEKSLIGKLVSDDGKDVCLMTEDKGKICFSKLQVVKISVYDPNKNKSNGTFGYENPHPSRYFYTPTGIPMEKGEGYIQTIYGAVWQFHYAITNNLSIGMGSTVWGSPLFVTAKYGMEVADNLYAAAGFQVGNLTYLAPSTNAGILFGSLTYGNKENNITAAGGYGFLSEKVNKYSNGMLLGTVRVNDGTILSSLSGTARMGKRASFMVEGWYLPQEQMFFGGPGIRYMKSATRTWDFSVIYTFIPGEIGIPIPFVSYTVKM